MQIKNMPTDSIHNAKSAFELEVAIKKLLQHSQNSQGSLDFVDSKLAMLLRDKIYKLAISKGRLLERYSLSLFRIYAQLNLQRDERFLKIRDHVLAQESSSDNEKILLSELAFLCDFLGSANLALRKIESLKIYIKALGTLDSHALEVTRAQAASLQILNGVDFLDFKAALECVFGDFWHYCSKERRSLLNACLHVFWNISRFYNDKRWLDLYPTWRALFDRALECDLELAVYMHFFIYHMCGNAFSSQAQWRTFNEDFTQKSHKFYANDESIKLNISLKDVAENSSSDKKKIGFLRDRLVLNSPMKVELSLLKTLTKEFEISIFLLSLIEKSDNDAQILKELLNLGVRVFDAGSGIMHTQNSATQIAPNNNKDGLYNSHLQKARFLESVIKNANLDMLISPNNGYGIADYVLAKRVCKKQIFWSHGNFVYDAPFIDKKITHICNLQEKITHEGTEFLGIPVKMSEEFYTPKVDFTAVENLRSKYLSKKVRVILGSIGRLVKMESDAFMQALIEILRRRKDAIFLACGGGSAERIRAKITSDKSMKDRIIFPGYVDSALYGYVIDFWLDSFPQSHGESRIEFMAKGRLSLMLSAQAAEVRRSNIIHWTKSNETYINEALKASKMEKRDFLEFITNNNDLVAFDPKDYVQKALKALSMDEILKATHLECAKIIRASNDLAKSALTLSRFKKL